MLKHYKAILALALSLSAFSVWAVNSAEPQRQTIYVAATGNPSGTGASDAPFVLSAGREYEFNRLIRSATDAGKDVEVIFASGTYQNVRLQIIKQGIDSDSFYDLEEGPDANGKKTMVFGKPYHYRSYSNCNNQGMNCRVEPADYALGPHSSARVVLKSAELHQAIFDGKDFQTTNPDITNHALIIAGAYTNVIETGRTGIKSEPIKNIAVTGFVFRNYQNGIFVQHGLGITIDDCIVENTGTHHSLSQDEDNYGVEGFSAKGDSQVVLVKNSKIINSWNTAGAPGLKGSKDWPGLMHAIYNGYSRDIIFINNEVTGSSGPIVKFGNYPISKNGRIIYQYGDKTWERRGFFIGNQFAMAPITNNGETQAPYLPIEAFIHDNSQEKDGGGATAATKGMVFLNNRFRNLLPGDAGAHVAFIRQELPVPGLRPNFPDFYFGGNVVEGVQPNRVLMHRSRGTPVSADSAQADDPKGLGITLPTLNQLKVAPVDVGPTIDRLLTGPLRSPQTDRDQLISTIIRTGEIPRMP